MNKKWFIAQLEVDYFEKIMKNSFLGDRTAFDKPKKLGLLNKNNNRMYYWRNPKRTINRIGWIVERGSCPKYFKDIVIQENE